MSEEIVKIKGIKEGLLLTFASYAAFDAIESNIKQKLTSGFFTRGTPVYIKPDALTEKERENLKKLFNRHGLICKTENPERKRTQNIKSLAVDEKNEVPNVEVSKNAKVDAEKDAIPEMTVIDRTLRGGQEVRAKSSVLVLGNVNPGAQIIAGGSIDIRGKCLGVVHAGAYGNREAVIIADRLLPTQIRIADLVARAPDDGDGTEKPERASIKDGQIVIEPIDRFEKGK